MWNTGCIRFRHIQSSGNCNLYATGLTTCMILNGPVYLADSFCEMPGFNDKYLVDNNTSSPSLKLNSLRCLLAYCVCLSLASNILWRAASKSRCNVCNICAAD